MPTKVRPVRCWFCNRQMFYAGQPEHEPEVRVVVEGYSKDNTDVNAAFYAHQTCWDEAIKPKDNHARTKPNG